MIGIKYAAGKKEADAVADLRNGLPIAVVAKRHRMHADALVEAYEGYILQRIATMQGPEAARVNEQYLDRLDSLIERYYPLAAQGDQAVARLIVTLIQTVSNLREKFLRQELLRLSSQPTTEIGKAAAQQAPEGGGYRSAKERWEQLVRLRDEHGIPIPPEVALAYREILIGAE